MLRRSLLLLALAAALSATDWPQFLGPQRNGTFPGAVSLKTPRLLWKKDVGAGFSAPVVANGKLILFHRMNDKEIVKFGIAFNEASGPCLTRVDGNDGALQTLAMRNATAIGAGHCFVIAMREGYPINILTRIHLAPEVCTVYCATANPVEVIVAETGQGRGILGVIDGSSPRGVESEDDAKQRHGFLRTIGYKR